mgnify:CR=1 FL=1
MERLANAQAAPGYQANQRGVSSRENLTGRLDHAPHLLRAQGQGVRPALRLPQLELPEVLGPKRVPAWLQDHDCLRLVPAADGSFRANVLRFQKGSDARVILGAGQLTPPGLMASLDAMVVWAGPELDPFAVSVDVLLGRAKEKGHVPSGEELADYARAYYAGAELWDQLFELGAPFIRTTARDADMPELELVADKKSVARAMKAARKQLLDVTTVRRRQRIGFHGGSDTFTIHWCPALKMWVLFQDLDNRFWNCFGITRPDPNKSAQITVQVNPPFEGLDRKVGGAFARDPHTGDVYFIHRGRIGGGQKGIGPQLFWSRFRGGANMREPDESEPSRVVVVGKVGKVGSPEFARDVAGFVHEVARIKAAG